MNFVSVATHSVAWSIDTVFLSIHIVFLTIHIVAEAIYSLTFTSYSGVLIIHIPTDIIVPTTLSIHFVAETIVETLVTIVASRDAVHSSPAASGFNLRRERSRAPAGSAAGNNWPSGATSIKSRGTCEP
jgi:hypothetical protein